MLGSIYVKQCQAVVAWRVTGEDQYLKMAKTQLMNVASWDVEGPTARTYNDEAAFRVTTALAWGYDWLHDVLTDDEKAKIKAALMYRARELYDYVRNQIQVHIKLLDSHGVRSLSMTLVPAALALLGEEAEAREWWDFSFDTLFFRMLFQQTKPQVPGEELMVAEFPAIGWACIHRDMADEQKHLAFIFKSSPYGSVSHSHGDQNAFVLHAFGEPLAIQSGYYIGFWSEMHTRWRRHTKSKNAVLIDGIGQFAELKKNTKAEEMNGSAKTQFDQLISANGRLEVCEQRADCVYLRGDATAAFRDTVPYLKKNKRHVLFAEESFFVMIDEIKLEQEGTVQWLLHGLHEFTIGGKSGSNEFDSLYHGVGLRVIFVDSEMEITQSNEFDGVASAETEGLAVQWHVTASTIQAKRNHRLVTILYPYRAEDERALDAAICGEQIAIKFGDKRLAVEQEQAGYVIK